MKSLKFLIIFILIFTITFNSYVPAEAIAITLAGTAVTVCSALLVAAGVKFATDDMARLAGWQYLNSLAQPMRESIQGMKLINGMAGAQLAFVANDIWDNVKGYVFNNYQVGDNAINTAFNTANINGYDIAFIPTGTELSYNMLPDTWLLPNGSQYGLKLTLFNTTSTYKYYNLNIVRDGIVGKVLRVVSVLREYNVEPSAKLVLQQSDGGLYAELGYYYTIDSLYFTSCINQYDKFDLETWRWALQDVSALTATGVADSSTRDMTRDYNSKAGDRAVVIPSSFAGATDTDVWGSVALGGSIGDDVIGDDDITDVYQNIVLGWLGTISNTLHDVLNPSWVQTLTTTFVDGFTQLKTAIMEMVGTLTVDFVSPFYDWKLSIDNKYMPIFNNFKNTINSMNYAPYVFEDIYADLFGSRYCVVRLSLINDYLPTVRTWSGNIFWLFYAFYVYDQLYFLIRGTHALNMSIASANLSSQSKGGKEL